MITAALIILPLIVITLSYVTYNLLKKVEKLEELALSQSEFIKSFQTIINASDEKLKEIDENGTFQSDDEIGWFFNSIKVMQDNLNNFKS